MINPYLDEFNLIQGGTTLNGFGLRESLVRKYAWGIPDEESIRAIRDVVQTFGLKGVVEMAAGSGYWGSLLKQAGVEWRGFDEKPWQTSYAHVSEGTPATLGSNVWKDWLLLLCWPPYAEPMAYDALMLFTGRYVCYVGEGDGGCTADDAFHELLRLEWEVLVAVENPSWWGINDELIIYVKKASP